MQKTFFLPKWWNKQFLTIDCSFHQGNLIHVEMIASSEDCLQLRWKGESDKKSIEKLCTWVEAFLQGQILPFSTLPLLWNTLPSFTKQVLQFLSTIPMGSTSSYLDVAKALGKPLAPRAVGGACGRNPFPFFIPCHRVVASDGSLGGFSGGLVIKEMLLAFEKMMCGESL